MKKLRKLMDWLFKPFKTGKTYIYPGDPPFVAPFQESPLNDEPNYQPAQPTKETDKCC